MSASIPNILSSPIASVAFSDYLFSVLVKSLGTFAEQFSAEVYEARDSTGGPDLKKLKEVVTRVDPAAQGDVSLVVKTLKKNRLGFASKVDFNATEEQYKKFFDMFELSCYQGFMLGDLLATVGTEFEQVYKNFAPFTTDKPTIDYHSINTFLNSYYSRMTEFTLERHERRMQKHHTLVQH